MGLWRHLEKVCEEAEERDLAAKISISLPAGLLGEVDAWADQLGFKRSSLIAELLKVSIGELNKEMAKAEVRK